MVCPIRYIWSALAFRENSLRVGQSHSYKRRYVYAGHRSGGLDIAMAMGGAPFYLNMPRIVGVRLSGHLQAWVSAKDVILELLRRQSVKGGVGKIYEYFGPGGRDSYQ